jgi:4-hydroxybenzoate polyprenyltransferase
MTYSELFWPPFFAHLGRVLGTTLGLIPLLLLVFGGFTLVMYVFNRSSDLRDHRVNRLGERMAYLEARVLPPEEARRQRGA